MNPDPLVLVCCGAGPGNEALPSCFHGFKEVPCAGEAPCPEVEGSAQPKESLWKAFWAALSQLGASALPWLSSAFWGSQPVSSCLTLDRRAGDARARGMRISA